MKASQLFCRTNGKVNFFHHFTLTMAVGFLLLCVSQNAQALTKPTLQSPANNAQITASSITFSWSHPYNDQYEVKIKTNGGTLKYASGKTSSKSKTVNLSSLSLTSGSTYKWYVVVYANGQEISSSDSWFTYKTAASAPVVQQKPVVSGRVDLSGGVNVSPSTVTIGQNFTVSFTLKEFQGGTKTLEYVQLWIQNSAGGDLYTAQQWSNVAFAANQQRSFSATTSLNPSQGRGAGTYRAIIRGKVAGEAPFNFGVVGGSGWVNPRAFTAVATVSPPPSSPSQSQPGKPTVSTPGDQQKPAVSGFDVKKVGDIVTVSYRVTDSGGSGLKQVELWRSPNNRDWSEVSNKRQYVSGNSASGSFSDIPQSAGTFYYGVHVVDKAGNWSGEGGPKSVTIGKSSEQNPPSGSPPSQIQPQPGKPSVSTSADQQKPVVSGFDVKKVGNTVTVSYKVMDAGGSGLKQVELWRSPNRREWSEVSGKRQPASGNSASGSISDTPPSAGTFYYGIHVVDQAGNWSSENGPRSVTIGKSSGQNPPSGSPPSQIQPQPGKPSASTSADQQKPVISGFYVKKVGNTVSISYRVTDSGGSGLKQVELWRSPNNREWSEVVSKRRSVSGNSASGSISDTPPSAGTFYYGIHVVDRAGNWSGEGGPKSVTVGNSQGQTPPVSPSGDKQKPVVSGFDVKKVGNTVSISYRVTDSGGSGLKQVELWRSPNNREWSEVSGKRQPASGNSASGSISDTPPSAGTFYYGIHVVDQVGNWSSENGPKSVTVAKSSGQTPPVAPSGDHQKPVVSGFDVKKVGNTVSISYRVTDAGGSGLKQVELWRSPNRREWSEVSGKRQPVSGNSASGSISDTPPSAGTFYYGIHVVDQAGNWSSENGPKSVTVAKSSGQTSIPLNVSQSEQNLQFPPPKPFPEPNFDSSAYRSNNPLWQSGYAPKRFYPSNKSPSLGDHKGNCTWYANGRLRELGFKVPNGFFTNNAYTWDENADKGSRYGITKNKEPRVGSIAQSNNYKGNKYGHVAFVESVRSNGIIVISESSYSDNKNWDFEYHTREVEKNDFTWYIHLPK